MSYHGINYQMIRGTPDENGLTSQQIGVGRTSDRGSVKDGRRWFDMQTGEVGGSGNMDDPKLVKVLAKELDNLTRYRTLTIALLAKNNPKGWTFEYQTQLRVRNRLYWQILDRLGQIDPDYVSELTPEEREPA